MGGGGREMKVRWMGGSVGPNSDNLSSTENCESRQEKKSHWYDTRLVDWREGVKWEGQFGPETNQHCPILWG
jgi:hypothetical protein